MFDHFVCPVIRPSFGLFIRPFARSFDRRSVGGSLTRSFALFFDRSSARWLVNLFARSLVRSFARSLVRSFAHISYYQKELNYFLRFPYGLGIWWEHRSGHGSGTWPESTDQGTLYPFPSENSSWPHVHEGGGLWMQRYCLKRDFISVYTWSMISMPHFSHQLPLILRQMSYIELQKTKYPSF